MFQNTKSCGSLRCDDGLSGHDGPLSRPSSGNFLDAGFEDFKEQPAREVEVDADLARA
jgi:hypothetical protein